MEYLQQPFQIFFIFYVLGTTPVIIYFFWRFITNMNLQPIEGRFPVWSLITAFGAAMYQLGMTTSLIFVYHTPCGYQIFFSQLFVGMGSDAALNRAFLLYFQYNLSLINVKRAQVQHLYPDDDEARSATKTTSGSTIKRLSDKVNITNFFTKNRHKTEKWARWYFVIATVIRASGTVVFFIFTEDPGITNFTCVGVDPGRIAADWVSLICFGLFVFIMGILVFKLKPTKDGLEIKTELRNLALCYLIGIVVWFVFANIPKLLEIEKNTFPIPPMWLCLMCLYTLYITLVVPYRKTQNYKYSIITEVDMDLSKEERRNVAAIRRRATTRAIGETEEDTRPPWGDGPIPGSRLINPQSLTDAFKALLADDACVRSFTSFLQLEFAVENIFFLQATDLYYKRHLKFGELLWTDLKTQKKTLTHAKELEQEFVSSDSPMTCNLMSENKKHVLAIISKWEELIKKQSGARAAGNSMQSVSDERSHYYSEKYKKSVTSTTRIQYLLQSEQTPLRFQSEDSLLLADTIEMISLNADADAENGDLERKDSDDEKYPQGGDRISHVDEGTEESPLDDSQKDDSQKDDSQEDDSPEDDSPEDDSPEDDSFQDDSPQDGTPQDLPQDDSPQDDSPQDDSPQSDLPQDDSPLINSHQDDSPLIYSHQGPELKLASEDEEEKKEVEVHELVKVFQSSNDEIFKLLRSDSFRRYIRSEHYYHFMVRRDGVPIWRGDSK